MTTASAMGALNSGDCPRQVVRIPVRPAGGSPWTKTRWVPLREQFLCRGLCHNPRWQPGIPAAHLMSLKLTTWRWIFVHVVGDQGLAATPCSFLVLPALVTGRTVTVEVASSSLVVPAILFPQHPSNNPNSIPAPGGKPSMRAGRRLPGALGMPGPAALPAAMGPGLAAPQRSLSHTHVTTLTPGAGGGRRL